MNTREERCRDGSQQGEEASERATDARTGDPTPFAIPAAYTTLVIRRFSSRRSSIGPRVRRRVRNGWPVLPLQPLVNRTIGEFHDS